MNQDQSSEDVQPAPAAPPADNGQGLHIEVSAGEAGDEIVQRLQLSQVGKGDGTKAVIVLVGTTDLLSKEPQAHARLVQLFGHGLARAASSNTVLTTDTSKRNKALIIDANNGNEAAAALSKVMFDNQDNALLIKVSEDEQPAQGRVDGITNASTTPKKRYSHSISIKDGSGTAGVVNTLACELAKRMPVLTVLVNDAPQARDVVAHSVKWGWPVMIVQGSKGLADLIYDKWRERISYLQQLATWKSGITAANADELLPPSAPFIDDLQVAEIVKSGDLHFFDIGDTPEKLELYIKQRFEASTLLDNVFDQQQVYSQEASEQQRVFRRQQNSILILGVVITFLAALQTALQTTFNPNPVGIPALTIASVHILLVALPAIVTVLIAGSNRFNPGSKWVMLRTASEIYKREMFRYCTRTGAYSDAQVALNKTTREIILSRALENANKQWVENNLNAPAFTNLLATIQRNSARTSQHQTSIIHKLLFWRTKPSALQEARRSKNASKKPPANLAPEGYIEIRLVSQLNYYKDRIVELDIRLKILQWLIIALGGGTTVLGAFNIALPITVITALGTALGGYLEYTQVSNTLKQYKHVFLTLTDLQRWWKALGDAQSDPLNVDRLVEYVETSLQSEHVGWVQQMQAALTDLREQQAKRGEGSSRERSDQQ